MYKRGTTLHASTLHGALQAVVAAHTRLLFHGAGPFEECPGCLLEQLAK